VKKVDRSELLGLGAYEEVRERFRARIIQLKKTRRVAVGPHMTFVFENHDTALFQIQEMLRTERITDERAIAHELETYNDLVPDEGELSATLFVEYDDKDERASALEALVGLADYVALWIHDRPFDARFLVQAGEETTRLPAVGYVRFRVGRYAAPLLRDREADAHLEITHAAYSASATLSAETRASLADDLDG